MSVPVNRAVLLTLLRRSVSLAFLSISIACVTGKAQVFSPDSVAAKFRSFSSWCSPEKLYVHLDRTYYAIGETIWFKGYLSNVFDESLVPESNYIYAELLDKDGETVSRVKIKRTEDGFPGHMYLPETLPTGYYTFRAYTLWQTNGAPDYMFNQRIRILGEKPFDTPVAVNPDYDVTFYPEGGRCIAGVSSWVAFKCLDSEGKSRDFDGFLVTEGGEVLRHVCTRHDGMGMFFFTPSASSRCFLKSSDGKLFPLPEPAGDGAALGIKNLHGTYYVHINGKAPGHCHLLIRNPRAVNVACEATPELHSHFLPIGQSLLSSGINHALLVDEYGRIVSERLFFVYESGVPTVNVVPDTYSPQPHAPISLELSLRDAAGAPVDGEFSISVTRGSFKGHQQDDGIVSYRYLSSELRGHINNPGYYFDESRPVNERAANIDLLMMVQGWRYYDIDAIVSPVPSTFLVSCLREYEQTIRGRIERLSNSKKMPSKFVFSVMIPELNLKRFVSVEKADSFILDSLDFEEGTDFLISTTRTGIGADYVPKWAGDSYAESYMYYPAPGKTGAVMEEEKIPLFPEVVTLDTLAAAVVSASRSDAFDNHIGGSTISGDRLERYRGWTLIRYLTERTPQFEYDGELMYNKNMRSEESGTVSQNWNYDLEFPGTKAGGTKSGEVKLVVDDFEEPWWSYEYVQCEDIEEINVSTMSDPVYNSPGGLVMLKLKPDVHLASAPAVPSLLYFVPLGYQKPTSFYSPRYDLGEERKEFDHRNTIFWSPSEHTDCGTSKLTFCNTDQMDYPYIVRIEGQEKNGVPFSKHIVLDFK